MTSAKARTLNMTQGAPMKMILIYAVPLLLGTLFQQFYNVVDTMIAGQFLGSHAVAAIGSTSMLYQMILGIAMGLNNGCAIVLSRLFGTGDREMFRKGSGSMLCLSMGLSLIISVLSLSLAHTVLVGLDTPADIFKDALTYINIIFGGILLTGLYNMSAGFLRSVGNSRTPLYFLILSSLLNIALDLFLVAVLHMGVAGTAIATISAQGISAVCCIIYILKYYKDYLPKLRGFRIDKAITREMFLTGLSMAVMEGIYATGSVFLQKAINGLGTAVITAHTSARRIIDLLKAPLATLGNATAIFAGQNYGAGRMDRVHRAVREAVVLSACWCVIAFVFAFFGSTWLLRLLSGSSEAGILQNAKLYLRISTVFLFPLALLFVLRFMMQATAHKIIPIFSSVIELAVKVISAFFLVERFGYPGAAATEPVIWLLCGVFLSVIYMVQKHQETREEK